MTQITIKTPQMKKGSYKIEIGANTLNSVLAKIQADFPQKKLYIITDSAVAKAGHLKTLLAGTDVLSYVIDPSGEVSKNINTVISIIEDMETRSLGRDSVITALGGGTVGDIAGFAAAIFKRGIPVVQVPTTTVSQADSAIGGKTGVDSSMSKNAFGAFWYPAAVFIDVTTLMTLQENEYLSGLVESVKHALIADAKYLEFIEKNIDRLKACDLEILEQIAVYNCNIKGRIVEDDPTEKNLRRVLNYGHTIGHAVESASYFRLLHGQAVAIGMVGAAMMEIEMGIGTQERLKRIESILKKLSQPTRIPADLPKEKIIDLLRRDKKAVNKWPKFVLLEKEGKVYKQGDQFAVDVNQTVVEKVLDQLYKPV
ncbi:MAG: 3-dehydroquinate synthase [Phycisphaerae bacterium]|nr:3-dehydroquinate synthase [Phycisphaerae bacterium]